MGRQDNYRGNGIGGAFKGDYKKKQRNVCGKKEVSTGGGKKNCYVVLKGIRK